jgi:hypothetical protein
MHAQPDLRYPLPPDQRHNWDNLARRLVADSHCAKSEDTGPASTEKDNSPRGPQSSWLREGAGFRLFWRWQVAEQIRSDHQCLLDERRTLLELSSARLLERAAASFAAPPKLPASVPARPSNSNGAVPRRFASRFLLRGSPSLPPTFRRLNSQRTLTPPVPPP